MINKNNIDYTLYLCTDRELMTASTVAESVEKAIKGGAGIVQLREKDLTSREFFNTAKEVIAVTEKYGIPLIINDRVDIALAVGAQGVHLGQKDLPCSEVRKLVGDDFLIGVSAATPEEAVKAENDGADYLGVGAVFSTSTKNDTRPVTKDIIKQIRSSVRIPFVIIGGVKKENVGTFYGLGINGAAVVSAVVGANDIEAAAREMYDAAKGLYL